MGPKCTRCRYVSTRTNRNWKLLLSLLNTTGLCLWQTDSVTFLGRNGEATTWDNCKYEIIRDATVLVGCTVGSDHLPLEMEIKHENKPELYERPRIRISLLQMKRGRPDIKEKLLKWQQKNLGAQSQR